MMGKRCLALTLTFWFIVGWLPGAFANSSNPASRTPGNSLEPGAGESARVVDPQGISFLRNSRLRSPSGILYPYPLVPQKLTLLGSGWLGRGTIELGSIQSFGDAGEARFQRYSDWSDGFLLRSLSAELLHPDRKWQLEIGGGSWGRDDGYANGTLSLLGVVRASGHWSRLVRVHANDARDIYRGAGTESLTLNGGLVPGANSDAGITSALTGIEESTLEVRRDDLGLSLDLRPLPGLELFARYNRTARDGARPFGGSWIYATGFEPNAAVVETTQPIDDRTHDVSTGLNWYKGKLSAQLAYTGSFYRNSLAELTFDNPFQIGPVGRGALNLERGRFALAPDSDWHNVVGELTLPMPMSGRVAATFSWTRSEQNQRLLAPTINSGLIGGAKIVNLDQWNTGSALSRDRADATANTRLANLDLSFRPWKPLRLGARLRYFDRKNHTRYTAYNPATNTYGYVAEDGALAVATPLFNRSFAAGVATDDWRYRSTPFDTRKLMIRSTADWRVQPSTTLGVRYEWERVRRPDRERRETREHRLRAQINTRALPKSTLRLSYEYGNRGGSGYNSNPYGEYYVSSLPGFTPLFGTLPPFTLAQLRKSDLSDRIKHVVNLRLNLLVKGDMDVSLTGRFRDHAHDADYGLTGERSGSLNLEWNIQPSPRWNAFVFAGWERSRRGLSGINDDPVSSQDPNAGGAVFPFLNSWSLDTNGDSVDVGMGVRRRLLEIVTVEANYHFVFGEQHLEYEFRSAGSLTPGDDPGLAGGDFPKLRTLDHILETSVRIELTDRLDARLEYRLQVGKLDDFQQSGIDQGLVGGGLFLGHVDRDFTAHVLGATLIFRF